MLAYVSPTVLHMFTHVRVSIASNFVNNFNQTNYSILYLFQPENDSASQKGATSDSRPPTTRAPSSLSSSTVAAAASTIEDEEASSTLIL